MGVGIDLLEIDRLERALARRPRLADRLFTERERAYAAGKGRPAQHLAARFCAKEAVAKALGLEAWSWQDIEVLPGPELVLHGPLAGRRVEISLTHSKGIAGAVAVAHGAGGPGGAPAAGAPAAGRPGGVDREAQA